MKKANVYIFPLPQRCCTHFISQTLGDAKSLLLTTRVRRHNVLAGARGSRAACRSHTLILLHGKSKCHKTNPKQKSVHKTVYLHDLPVVGAADNPFVVKANAAHQLLVTFQHS